MINRKTKEGVRLVILYKSISLFLVIIHVRIADYVINNTIHEEKQHSLLFRVNCYYKAAGLLKKTYLLC